MNDVGSAFKLGVELEHFPVILEELFLRVDLSASKFFLQVLLHLSVFLGNPFVVDSRGPSIVTIRL